MSTPSPTSKVALPPEGAAVDKGLKPGAIGLLSAIVLAVSSTAPAYALAATLGFVVIAVGVKAPAILLLAFIPMWLIAVAYKELNRREPDCGTTFTWAARAFGPRTGWMGGWGIIAADVIVMANLAQVAGSYGYRLLGLDGLADSAFWTTVAGVGWIALMTWICYRGIEPTARLQNVLLAVEVVVLVVFAGYALVKVYGGSAPAGSLTPSLSWLWPSGLDWASLTEAMLLAIFIYWGWDSALAVNEETRDPARSPGRAAVISTVLLVGIYVVVSIATVAFAGVGAEGTGLGNEANAEDVFAALGATVFGDDVVGRVLQALLILSVLTSSAASTQTTILPTARGTLAMGTYQALPSSFARIHPRYLTPSVSTIWMGIVSIAFYVGLTLVSDNVLQDSVVATGMLIAFYYGLTGFACAWQFRRGQRTARDVLMRVVLPLLGGLFMLLIFVLACVEFADPEYGETVVFGVGGVFVIGIGALLLGVVLMAVWNVVAPAFFRNETMLPGSGDLLPDPERPATR
ncbi:amino acid/polyamine/organocation transporter, APC superfamily (TC 2.A.3) [Modestobacter sp. DSM 44400]|uniref:APC family permease n=1 Tax=Modestobacter sp. DSM 44400 TaxID=1550230 RepID=UPI00089614C6|nr:APC family permease [Modestobacter sp. DSM 44400]SDY52987.1 amino acid/polyamine/organocation transporter, APC superfamily (TC 2.A.3) [Modestobacter sp. DSM 44400]